MCLSALTGVVSGLCTAIFLIGLQRVTDLREANPRWIWTLPLLGVGIGFLFHYGGRSRRGSALILEEIHDPKKILPRRMAPLVFIGTLLTHLGGGSAGREGAAVQMSAALADQLSRFFKIEPQERKTLLVAGLGAGFSAAIGAPWAGALFGMEILQIGRLKLFAIPECLIASFVGFYTCRWLEAEHLDFSEVIPFWDIKTILSLFCMAVVLGFFIRVFIFLTHGITKLHQRLRIPARWQPFIGGLILVFLYECFQTQRFAGLGLAAIVESFHLPAAWSDPLLKIFFTSLTLGSGFKGGEFIPLVFIGSTAGSFLAGAMGVSVPLLASVGFSAAFGAAANAPLSCALMAGELFGWSVFPQALFVGWLAYLISGDKGIYEGQKIVLSKKTPFLFLVTKLKSCRRASRK